MALSKELKKSPTVVGAHAEMLKKASQYLDRPNMTNNLIFDKAQKQCHLALRAHKCLTNPYE